MKRSVILLAATLSIAACTSKPDKFKDLTDSKTAVPIPVESSTGPVSQRLCFQKLAGKANQDTTNLSLLINGDLVSGDFANYPKEKDKRVGKITASKKDDLIKGVWIYMQEGMNDTLQVEFKLSGDKLVQKNYSIDPKTGREVFSEASVFNIEFSKVDCSN